MLFDVIEETGTPLGALLSYYYAQSVTCYKLVPELIKSNPTPLTLERVLILGRSLRCNIRLHQQGC